EGRCDHDPAVADEALYISTTSSGVVIDFILVAKELMGVADNRLGAADIDALGIGDGKRDCSVAGCWRVHAADGVGVAAAASAESAVGAKTGSGGRAWAATGSRTGAAAIGRTTGGASRIGRVLQGLGEGGDGVDAVAHKLVGPGGVGVAVEIG